MLTTIFDDFHISETIHNTLYKVKFKTSINQKKVENTNQCASMTASETIVLILHFPKTSRVADPGGLLLLQPIAREYFRPDITQ